MATPPPPVFPPAAPPQPPALVECDNTLPQPSRQAFLEQPVPVLDGISQYNPGLCHGRWQWYQVASARTRWVRTTSQQLDADGVVRAKQTAHNTTDTHAVVISFDSKWAPRTGRFGTSDIMVVNGQDALPSLWDTPAIFEPNAAAAAAEAGRIYWVQAVDSLTLTIGFNSTLSDAGCASKVYPLLLVGVRCAWGLAFACAFDISATLVPRRVGDNDVVRAPIEAGGTHIFALQLADFDSLALTLYRGATDVPNANGIDDTSTHEAPAHGLLGTLAAFRNTCPDPSKPLEVPTVNVNGVLDDLIEDDVIAVPVTNSSATASLEILCTDASSSGIYAIAVHASPIQPPLGLTFEDRSVGVSPHVRAQHTASKASSPGLSPRPPSPAA